MPLFNEQYFWDELRNHTNYEKRNLILKYEAMFGSLKDVDICQTRFYKNYLSKFNFPFRVNVPEDLKVDFDWDLLKRLIAGSYSCEMSLHVNQEWLKNSNNDILADIYIKVQQEDKEMEKRLDELWAFQILRLYEIFIEEQMNMLVSVHETDQNEDEDNDEVALVDVSQIEPVTDEDDKYLEVERMLQIQRFNEQITVVLKEIEKDCADKESEKETVALKHLLDEM